MFVIAKNTIKEFLRNKILYLIIALSVGLIFFTLIISRLAMSEQSKIILDFCFGIIEIFGLMLTLILGSSMVYNEINKNTILLLLSKKPSRAEFILGKYLGFSFINLALYLIAFIGFICVLFIHNISFDMVYVWALILSYLKLSITLGFIIFFSTFMSPLFSLLMSLGIYIISHSTAFLKFYTIASQKVQPGSLLYYVIDTIYHIFPNFQDLSMKEYLLSPYLGSYSMLHISISVLSSIGYIFILIWASVLVFQKKEF